eukprot:Polyplicarium_translucidae@DN1992_c0_g1_i1.p1
MLLVAVVCARHTERFQRAGQTLELRLRRVRGFDGRKCGAFFGADVCVERLSHGMPFEFDNKVTARLPEIRRQFSCKKIRPADSCAGRPPAPSHVVWPRVGIGLRRWGRWGNSPTEEHGRETTERNAGGQNFCHPQRQMVRRASAVQFNFLHIAQRRRWTLTIFTSSSQKFTHTEESAPLRSGAAGTFHSTL